MHPDDIEDELVEARERKRRAAAFARQREMLEWPKGKLFRHFLALGSVELSFDPRPCIVRVPRRWKSRTHLVVKVSAPGVEASDDHGVVAVAALAGRSIKVVVPWTVVYSMIGEDVGGIVWQGDAPPELMAELEPAADEPYIIREIGAPAHDARPANSVLPMGERIRGCLLGGALGDALAAAPDGTPGRLTVQPQMTLFTAEGLLRARDQPSTVERSIADLVLRVDDRPAGVLAAGALALIIRRLCDGDTLEQAINHALERLRAEPQGDQGAGEVAVGLGRALALAQEGPPDPAGLANLGDGKMPEERLAIGAYAALTWGGDARAALLLAATRSHGGGGAAAVAGSVLGTLAGTEVFPREWLEALAAREMIETVAAELAAAIAADGNGDHQGHPRA